MAALSIRPAVPADIADVADVHIRSWDAAKSGLELPTRRTVAARTALWTRFLVQARGSLVVADDGAVRAFIAFGDARDSDRSGCLEVYTLYVAPGWWSRGIGTALIAQVPSHRAVTLWVAERNERAQAFYRHRGFEPDGARETGHHVPVIRLVRLPAPGSPFVE